LRDKTEIQKEIQIHLKFIKELKEMIPLGLMLVIGWGFVLPVFAGRRRPSLAEQFGYKNAAIFCIFISLLIYLFACYFGIKNKKSEIAKLENELKQVNLKSLD
jgi:Ca2+/H+ antiporter